jgi:hypothetical protein
MLAAAFGLAGFPIAGGGVMVGSNGRSARRPASGLFRLAPVCKFQPGFYGKTFFASFRLAFSFPPNAAPGPAIRKVAHFSDFLRMIATVWGTAQKYPVKLRNYQILVKSRPLLEVLILL